ncbi:MAG: hypothetical protein R3C03_15745 [Pirellulaceae bacterium]
MKEETHFVVHRPIDLELGKLVAIQFLGQHLSGIQFSGQWQRPFAVTFDIIRQRLEKFEGHIAKGTERSVGIQITIPKHTLRHHPLHRRTRDVFRIPCCDDNRILARTFASAGTGI